MYVILSKVRRYGIKGYQKDTVTSDTIAQTASTNDTPFGILKP